MHKVAEKKIEDMLFEAGLISSEKLRQLKETQARTGEKIEQILLTENLANYKEISRIISKKMGVDYVDLETTRVNRYAVNKLNGEISKKCMAFPFELKGNVLYIAMHNPGDIFAIDELKVFTQMEIKPYLGDKRLISKAISYFYSVNMDPESGNTENSNSFHKTGSGANKLTDSGSKKDSRESTQTIDSLLRNIIIKSLRINASDIHIDAIGQRIRIRYRVDGLLNEEMIDENISFSSFCDKIKVMAELFTYDNSVPQKGRIHYEITKNEKMYIEVLTLPLIDGEKLLLKTESERSIYKVDELGFTDTEQEWINSLLSKKSGLVIATGLHGSGRTTTAYALLNKMPTNELNVITLEDRIIHKLNGVSQIRINDEQRSNLSEVVKLVLEHDPDVIMVDTEVDHATLKQLMNVAVGGKLVIITMLFPSVFDTLLGLTNMGFEPYTVAGSIEGIISQNLVRRLCPKCKNKGSRLSVLFDDLGNEKPLSELDCSVCNGSGYNGKVAVFELFKINKDYRKLLLRPGDFIAIEQKLEQEESSFKKNCERLISEEITSKEEVLKLGIGKEMFDI